MEGETTNNLVDLTNYFDNNPTMSDVKDFLNKMVQERKIFATSSPDWFIDIPVSSKKKDHIAKSSRYRNMNDRKRKRHNKYILALEVLLSKAQYIRENENSKKVDKPNINKYHYFKVEVKINEKIYKIIFDTEEYIGDNTTKPQTVHLYNVAEI